MTTTIFTEMTELAERTGAINLGQGFPDRSGPPAMLERAREAIAEGHNQYPPLAGVPELRAAVAEARLDGYGTPHDPDTEVVVTAGATEALAAAVIAHTGPGDEVVLLEPFYDAYAAAVRLAGATRRAVPLRRRGDAFVLDPAELAAAVGPRTRALVLNSPHNPTGKVYDADELDVIAELARAHDLLVIADEVYERLCFGSARHCPIGALPGMAQRTITVSSAAKTFSATGWKIGWVCGPAALVRAARDVKQFLTFAGGTPFQYAVAHALRHEGAWVHALREELEHNRDVLAGALRELGAAPLRSDGGYFLQIDARDLGYPDGVSLCRELPGTAGVVAVPTAAFCDDPARGAPFARFALSKRPEVVARAADRLRAAFPEARQAEVAAR